MRSQSGCNWKRDRRKSNQILTQASICSSSISILWRCEFPVCVLHPEIRAVKFVEEEFGIRPAPALRRPPRDCGGTERWRRGSRCSPPRRGPRPWQRLSKRRPRRRGVQRTHPPGGHIQQKHPSFSLATSWEEDSSHFPDPRDLPTLFYLPGIKWARWGGAEDAPNPQWSTQRLFLLVETAQERWEKRRCYASAARTLLVLVFVPGWTHTLPTKISSRIQFNKKQHGASCGENNS